MPAAAAVALALGALSLGGCLGLEPGRGERPSPAGVRYVDEYAGSYRGVALGTSEADVRRALGPPGAAGPAEPLLPLGAARSEIGGPPAPPVWPRGGGTRTVLRYTDVAFALSSRGVYAFVVTAPRARTRADVGVGDSLATAGRRYRLVCDPAGNDPSPDATCRTTVEGRRILHVWFGRDPIRSITVARAGAAG